MAKKLWEIGFNLPSLPKFLPPKFLIIQYYHNTVVGLCGFIQYDNYSYIPQICQAGTYMVLTTDYSFMSFLLIFCYKYSIYKHICFDLIFMTFSWGHSWMFHCPSELVNCPWLFFSVSFHLQFSNIKSLQYTVSTSYRVYHISSNNTASSIGTHSLFSYTRILLTNACKQA